MKRIVIAAAVLAWVAAPAASGAQASSVRPCAIGVPFPTHPTYVAELEAARAAAVEAQDRDSVADSYVSWPGHARWCIVSQQLATDLWLIPGELGLEQSEVHPSTNSAALDRETSTNDTVLYNDLLWFSDAKSPYSATYRWQRADSYGLDGGFLFYLTAIPGT